MRRRWLLFVSLLASLLLGESMGEASVAPGEEVTPANKEKIRGLIPDEFYPYVVEANPALHLVIEETGEYPVHPKYREATAKYACQVTLDQEGRLKDYVAGQPFPYSKWAQEATAHACDLSPEDPRFALKLAWNVNYRWQSSGLKVPHWHFSYERKEGKDMWRLAQGDYRRTYFSHRADLLPETHTIDQDSNLEWAEFFEFKTPFDLRGTMFLLYRYLDDKEDDTWAYIPALRRVRRLAVTQKSDSLLGSELTIEDFYLFSGYVTSHEWQFRGEQTMLAVMNAKRRCAPLNTPNQRPDDTGELSEREHFEACDFDPYGSLNFVGGESFEPRVVFAIDDLPKQKGHPYSRKRLWYDRETMMPVYGMMFDRAGKPYKLVDHQFVWSEDTGRPESEGQYMATFVGFGIANVQTGVSNNTQFYNSHGFSWPVEDTHRYFDITRLKKKGR